MKGKWFKPELSLDGVLFIGYFVASIFFVSGMHYQLDANGKAIHSISATQIKVLRCLQQTKDVIQSDHTNRLEIEIPEPPIFDSNDWTPNFAEHTERR